MDYMEVVRPAADGLCSDDACPCGSPGARIPRGGGYLYISQEVVDFRGDCLTLKQAEQKVSDFRSRMGRFVMFGAGVVAPILVCEQGARKRGLDLEVAVADARYWWQTGLAPLRATPLARARGQAKAPPVHPSAPPRSTSSARPKKKWWQFWK
jgi:hypothetical protein